MSATDSIAELEVYVRAVTRQALWVAAGLCAASFAFTPRDPSLAWGVLLGSSFSIIRFRLRARDLMRLAVTTERQGKRTLVKGSITAYLLSAIAISLAFVCDGVSTWAAVASLFLVNVIVVLTASQSSVGCTKP